MSGEHYFSPRPAARGAPRELTLVLRGREVTVTTEPGVFSRRRLDPGTRLLIERMEVRPAERFLDLGCGYGVVGLVAAQLAPQGSVTLLDVNERAVALARENLARNGAANAEALVSDGLGAVAGRRFDVIALNPPVRAGLPTVRRLIAGAREHLAPGGRFYLVGRTKQGVLRLAEELRRIFARVEEVAKRGGYRLYLAEDA